MTLGSLAILILIHFEVLQAREKIPFSWKFIQLPQQEDEKLYLATTKQFTENRFFYMCLLGFNFRVSLSRFSVSRASLVC